MKQRKETHLRLAEAETAAYNDWKLAKVRVSEAKTIERNTRFIWKKAKDTLNLKGETT